MKKSKSYKIARNSEQLLDLLAIHSKVDRALVLYKAELSEIARQSILSSRLQINEIVKLSGVARSKVSAVKSGVLAGISCDLFLKIISATGTKIQFKKIA